MSQHKNILLIQLRQLGDILLTSPCIREIKKENPGCRISFVCHRMGLSFLKDNPYLDEIFAYHESDSFIDKLKLLRRLYLSSFDLVIDFMNVPRSALFTLATQADTRLASKSSRAFAYNRLIPRSGGEGYIVDEKFEFLRNAGYSPTNIALDLPWFTEDIKPYLALSETKQVNFGNNKAKIQVILSPTHRRFERKWPASRYALLAKILVDQYDAIITWIWGPGESHEIDDLIDTCQVKTFKAPNTSLRELAALIANHDLFIGNSNGPSHIAVACQTPSLQLHGPTSARSWCPQNKRHIAIQAHTELNGETKSIPQISVSQVEDTLRDLLPEVLRVKAKRARKKPIQSWLDV